MNIWIVTTGNSDVQLITEDHWLNLYQQVVQTLNYIEFMPTPSENENIDIWNLPARVLAIAYKNSLDGYYNDLYFPLLNNYATTLSDNPKYTPEKILVLLTDQSMLISEEDRQSKKSPYWKDTCELQPIFEKYFREKFPEAELESLLLKPQSDKGLDDWDSAFNVVQQSLSCLKYSKTDTIYVSHQAGTPAISSALQFISLAKFGKKVKFLVSSEYKEEAATIVNSSKYLRGIQIEQAKSLVYNSPGAAKKILEEVESIEEQTKKKLDYYVDFFNLNRSLNSEQNEFSIEAATQRIVDALELISKFLGQENYLQGIALLAAAQETFLKVGILTKTKDLDINLNGQKYRGAQLLEWNNEGLLPTNEILNKNFEQIKIIFSKLHFGTEINSIDDLTKKKITNQNKVMLYWLKKLEPKFKPWSLLEWSCEYHRDRDKDLRNQLMHNLRGVEKSDVINYLLGNKNLAQNEGDNIMDIYNNKVKQPFLDAINLLGLSFSKEKLNKELNKLADLLS